MEHKYKNTPFGKIYFFSFYRNSLPKGVTFCQQGNPHFLPKKTSIFVDLMRVSAFLFLFLVSLKYQVKEFFAKIFGFGCRFPSVFFPHSKIFG